MNATVPLVILGFGAATGIALLSEWYPPKHPLPSAPSAEVRRSSSMQVPGRPAQSAPGGEEACSHCGGEESGGTVPASSSYPLATCVVSGEMLGRMGTPVAVVHGDVEVQLCCSGCIEEFRKAPDRYAALVSSAVGGAAPGSIR